MWQHASAGGVLFPVVYHRRDPGRWYAPVHRVASRSAHIAVGAGHGRYQARLGYLGPGPEEGASLKGGSCAPVLAQPQRRGVSDRRGGTSRLRAKRAGECDGLTGLPEANAGSPGPRPRSPPVWSTRFRAPRCGSSPTGESRKVAAALKADLHRPEPGGRLAGSDRLLRVRHGGQVPPVTTWERFTPSSWTHRLMLRRVISPPLRGRYPLHQQYRDCELPAAQGSPMNHGHFPFR